MIASISIKFLFLLLNTNFFHWSPFSFVKFLFLNIEFLLLALNSFKRSRFALKTFEKIKCHPDSSGKLFPQVCLAREFNLTWRIKFHSRGDSAFEHRIKFHNENVCCFLQKKERKFIWKIRNLSWTLFLYLKDASSSRIFSSFHQILHF